MAWRGLLPMVIGSSLLFVQGSITAARNVDDVKQTALLPLNILYQQDNARLHIAR